MKNKIVITGSAMLIRQSLVSWFHLPIDINGTNMNDDKIPKINPPILAKLSMYGNNPKATQQVNNSHNNNIVLPSNTTMLMSNLISSNQGRSISRHDCNNSTS